MNKNTFEHKGFKTKLMSPQDKKKRKEIVVKKQ